MIDSPGLSKRKDIYITCNNEWEKLCWNLFQQEINLCCLSIHNIKDKEIIEICHYLWSNDLSKPLDLIINTIKVKITEEKL